MIQSYVQGNKSNREAVNDKFSLMSFLSFFFLGGGLKKKVRNITTDPNVKDKVLFWLNMHLAAWDNYKPDRIFFKYVMYILIYALLSMLNILVDENMT